MARPDVEDPQSELIRRKGDEHERAYLAQLRAEGKSVLVVDTDDGDWKRAARITADAIRSGSHDVVYQGVLIDADGWRGVADFIERQADGSYEVSDTKLARHSKPYFLLQLSFYSEQLGRGQGRLPERMHFVLGTNDRESLRVATSSRTTGAYGGGFSGSLSRRLGSSEILPLVEPSVAICLRWPVGSTARR